MFNYKKSLISQILPQEKNLRQNNLGPVADDGQAITEKELPHRINDDDKTNAQQIVEKKLVADNSDIQILEKVLNEAKGYIKHRDDNTWISVPPISALTEKLRQERLEKDWKPKVESHWSLTYDEKAQQSNLPSWEKNAPQHDKIVLNNDPSRFTGLNSFPIHDKQPDNDKARSKSNDITPLVGNITTAHVVDIATQIKMGQTIDYDTAIIAILREADKETRELNDVERKSINDLKIRRTQHLLQNNEKNNQ